MRKLLATAAFLLASTAAQAQYTFEYGGRTIRIDPDRGTVQIPGVYDNTGQGKAKKAKKNETTPGQQAPQQAKVDPQPPAAPAPAPAPAAAPPATEQAPAAAAPPPVPPPPAPPPSATASNAPAETAVLPPPSPHSGARSGRAAGSARRGAAAGPDCGCCTPGAASSPRSGPRTRSGGCRRTAGSCSRARARSQFTARHLAHRGEGRQGPHRAMRQQSLRLFGRQQIEPERRTGPDQHEARQGRKWSGRILDPQLRLDLNSTIAMRGTDTPARAGLRLWRHVLRRPDLDARELKSGFDLSNRDKGPAIRTPLTFVRDLL